jgi:hypothetical protein
VVLDRQRPSRHIGSRRLALGKRQFGVVKRPIHSLKNHVLKFAHICLDIFFNSFSQRAIQGVFNPHISIGYFLFG